MTGGILFLSLVLFLSGHFLYKSNFLLSNLFIALSAIIFSVIVIKYFKKDMERVK